MDSLLYHGDCGDILPTIKQKVDLVLVDPPYGMMNGTKMMKRYGDDWDGGLDIPDTMNKVMHACRRNAAVCVFGVPPFTFQLIGFSNMPFAYRYIWVKNTPAVCAYKLSKKAPVPVCEEVFTFFKKYDVELSNPLRDYSRQMLKAIGMSRKQVNAHLGHRRAEHFFYFDSTQFSICTEKTYNELVELVQDESFQVEPYQFLVDGEDHRTYNLHGGRKFHSNVLYFDKPSKVVHPTQKPVELLEHFIKTYTNEGDTVLDFTMGSGSTGVAAKQLNRKFIGIEMEEKYFNIAEQRISEAVCGSSLIKPEEAKRKRSR